MGYDVTFHLVDPAAIANVLLPALLESPTPPLAGFAGIEDPASFWADGRERVFSAPPTQAAHAASVIALRWSAVSLPWVWTRNLAVTHHPLHMEDELRCVPSDGFGSPERELFNPLIARRSDLRDAFAGRLDGQGRCGGYLARPYIGSWSHEMTSMFGELHPTARPRMVPLMALARAAVRGGLAVWEASDLVYGQAPRPDLLNTPGLDRYVLHGHPPSDDEWSALLGRETLSHGDLCDLIARAAELLHERDARRINQFLDRMMRVRWSRLDVPVPVIDVGLFTSLRRWAGHPEVADRAQALFAHVMSERGIDRDTVQPTPALPMPLDAHAVALSRHLAAASNRPNTEAEQDELLEAWIRVRRFSIEYPARVPELAGTPDELLFGIGFDGSSEFQQRVLRAIVRSADPAPILASMDEHYSNLSDLSLPAVNGDGVDIARSLFGRRPLPSAAWAMLAALSLDERIDVWVGEFERGSDQIDLIWSRYFDYCSPDAARSIVTRHPPSAAGFEALAFLCHDLELTRLVLAELGDEMRPWLQFAGSVARPEWARMLGWMRHVVAGEPLPSEPPPSDDDKPDPDLIDLYAMTLQEAPEEFAEDAALLSLHTLVGIWIVEFRYGSPGVEPFWEAWLQHRPEGVVASIVQHHQPSEEAFGALAHVCTDPQTTQRVLAGVTDAMPRWLQFARTVARPEWASKIQWMQQAVVG